MCESGVGRECAWRLLIKALTLPANRFILCPICPRTASEKSGGGQSGKSTPGGMFDVEG